jgi:hypothetical protein
MDIIRNKPGSRINVGTGSGKSIDLLPKGSGVKKEIVKPISKPAIEKPMKNDSKK